MSYLNHLLVSSAVVKDFTGSADGVEDRKLRPQIILAQHELMQILGETLYEDVDTAHTANATTLGGAGMLTLYTDYLKPFLCWKTIELSAYKLHNEPDRNGHFERNGNDYTSVSAKMVEGRKSQDRSNAELYQGKMIRYIHNLESTDPIRIAFEEDVDDEPRVKKSYPGVFLTPNKYSGNVNRRGYYKTDCDEH